MAIRGSWHAGGSELPSATDHIIISYSGMHKQRQTMSSVFLVTDTAVHRYLKRDIPPRMLLQPLCSILVVLGPCHSGSAASFCRRPFCHSPPCLNAHITRAYWAIDFERCLEGEKRRESVSHPLVKIGQFGRSTRQNDAL